MKLLHVIKMYFMKSDIETSNFFTNKRSLAINKYKDFEQKPHEVCLIRMSYQM